MIKWIIILLIVAAVASLLGLNTLSGVAMTGAKILIGVLLVLFLVGFSLGPICSREKISPRRGQWHLTTRSL